MTTDDFRDDADGGRGELRFTLAGGEPRPAQDGPDGREPEPYTASEQDEVAARLEALGYIE